MVTKSELRVTELIMRKLGGKLGTLNDPTSSENILFY